METENKHNHQEKADQRLIDPLDFVVGEKDCTFNKVVRALDPDKCTPLITKYMNIGRTFGVDDSKMKTLDFRYKTGTITMESIYDEMLQNWRNKESYNATLRALIKILRQHGLNAAADKLLKEFGIYKPNPPKRSSRLKLVLLILTLVLFAITVSTGCLAYWFYFNQEELPKFKNTIPQKPGFYIPRTLHYRSYVSSKFFRYPSDIFVISGIQRPELSLSCFAGSSGSFDECRRTDYLAKQLNREIIDVRYMIINQKDHFDKLCGKTNESVHWLEYKREEKVFRWVKSRGGMEVLQNNLMDKHTDELNETGLLEKLEKNENILIYGGPGTGKTTLITEIGKRLQEAGQQVIFFSFPQLVNQLKMLHNEGNFDGRPGFRELLTKVIVAQICGNSMCEKVTTINLATGISKLTLLLDNYDQIGMDDLSFMYDYLKTLQTWNATRLVVTTRPHLLTYLENVLQTFGHHLLPFTEDDQVNFLNSYWSMDRPNLNLERLSNFSSSVLATLKLKIDDKERSVTGVALLCLVVAQVYENDAVSYSDLENVIDMNLNPNIEVIGSIWELFDRLIEIKFKAYNKLSNENRKEILFSHAFHAIRFLFPNFIFTPFLLPQFEISNSTNIIKLGILEKISNDSNLTPVFYHQTFADYFVAWYILETLENEENLHKYSFQEFLFGEILDTVNTSVSVQVLRGKESIEAYQFENKMVTQFLDSGLKSTRVTTLSQNISQIQNCSNEICHFDKLYACAYSDLFSLFKAIISVFGNNAVNVISPPLTSICILKSSVSFLTFVKKFKSKVSTPSKSRKLIKTELEPISVLNPLSTAICRGDYDMFEYIWASNLPNSVKTQCLLQQCVCYTKHDNHKMISDKRQIIRFIVNFYNESVLEKTWEECPYTPLLCYSAHYELILELLEQGADELAKNTNNETILHISAVTHSPNDFDKIFSKIEDKRESSVLTLLSSVDYKGRTPLHIIVSNFEPLDETLEKIYINGADFNSVDNEGASVIISAINSHRSAYLLGRLKNLGADYSGGSVEEFKIFNRNKDWTRETGLCPAAAPHKLTEPDTKGTSLHVAVNWGDVDAVRFLISVGLNVNQAKHPNHETPLEIVAKMDWRGSHVPVAEVLIECGANVDEVREKIREKKGDWIKYLASDEIMEVLNLDY